MVLGLVAVANIGVGGLLVVWLLEGNLKNKLSKAFKNPFFWGISALYFLNIVGLLYTDNLDKGFRHLFLQLPILVFPLMLAGRRFTRKEFHGLIWTFILSCFVASVVGFIGGYYLFLQTGDSGYLYSDNITISINKQAIYFAVYINVALVSLIYLLFTFSFSKLKKAGLIFLIFFLLIEIFILASRISIGVLVILIIIGVIYYIIQTRRFAVGIGLAIIGIGFLLTLAVLFPKTVNRFKSITQTEFTFENKNPVNHFNAEVREEYWNGLTLRLAIWTISKEIISENPLIGVGTGDYKIVLFDKYEDYNFHYGLEHQLSTHNQYIFIAVSFGIIGLIIFIIGYFSTGIKAIKEGKLLYVAVFIVFLLSFLTENFLNRNMGILLFAVISSLYFFTPDVKAQK